MSIAVENLTYRYGPNTGGIELVKNAPHSWADLLKPEFKNSVVYLDPR